MARNFTQIDPLDLASSRGVGVAIPFNGPGVFKTNFTTKEQTKSNLINLVLTEPGERVYKPFFGVGLNSLLFEQSVNEEDLKQKIQEAISKDERLSKITISNVNINQDINTNNINISIEYILQLDGSLDSIKIRIGSIDERGPLPYERKTN
tara:strand:- start:1767 stop:2219 length:453 start_codon:yes stop_codon:yes gene_type:complete